MKKIFEFHFDKVFLKTEMIKKIEEAVDRQDQFFSGCDQCFKNHFGHCKTETMTRLTKNSFKKISMTSDVTYLLIHVKTGKLTSFSGLQVCESLYELIREGWEFDKNHLKKVAKYLFDQMNDHQIDDPDLRLKEGLESSFDLAMQHLMNDTEILNDIVKRIHGKLSSKEGFED